MTIHRILIAASGAGLGRQYVVHVPTVLPAQVHVVALRRLSQAPCERRRDDDPGRLLVTHPRTRPAGS